MAPSRPLRGDRKEGPQRRKSLRQTPRCGSDVLYAGAYPAFEFSMIKHSLHGLTVLFCLVFDVSRAASATPATYGQQVVAAVLMGEAWGEGEKAMIAVAEVIRLRADRANLSPLAVVLKPRQFTCLNRTSPGDLIRRYHRQRDFEVALKIARQMYNQPESLPGHSAGATHFERVGTWAYWTRGHLPVARVGQLAFYRLAQ